MEGFGLCWLYNADQAEIHCRIEWFVLVDSHSSTRLEGEKWGPVRRRCRAKAGQEKWALGKKRKWACLLWVSVQLWRGARVRQKVDKGPASGKCEDEHPVVTMMFGAINDAWCMEDRIDVIILQNHTQAKNRAIFFEWKWKRNDRQKAKYLWDDLNKEK